MAAPRRDLDLGSFAWLLLMRDLPARGRNEGWRSFMRGVAQMVHSSVRLLPRDAASDIPSQKERSLVFWIQMGEMWRVTR